VGFELPANAGSRVIAALAAAIRQNAAELSAIDGAIGDGDHGVNMSKGFGLTADRVGTDPLSLSKALRTLGDVLLCEIGGAMGPLYGTFFLEMGAAADGLDSMDAASFLKMLDAGLDGVIEVGGAAPGDKTLVDVLVPARAALADAIADNEDLGPGLQAMASAGEAGRDATRGLAAKLGRASRLGDRSRGHLDAGATSCALILRVLAEELRSMSET
jgi:phosphoenolpyruvate---glycerone phosphotransferase subunit DhaL